MTELPDLYLHYHARRVGETWVRVNYECNLSGRTARARWQTLKKTNKGNLGSTRTNRLAKLINGARSVLGADLIQTPRGGWDIGDHAETVISQLKGKSVLAFTDGSTDLQTDGRISGAGVCLVADSKIVWAGGFKVLSEGQNYLAEFSAACLAVALVPPDSP